MFLARQSLNKCIDTFHILAQRVFSARRLFGNSFLGKAYSALLCLLTDSFYGSSEMEACVTEAFGPSARLFDGQSHLGLSGGKFAVTTMQVSNSRLCILSNYNGVGKRLGRNPYR